MRFGITDCSYNDFFNRLANSANCTMKECSEVFCKRSFCELRFLDFVGCAPGRVVRLLLLLVVLLLLGFYFLLKLL
jgi:hypothetical protein